MAKKLTRHRKHSPDVLLAAYVEAAYEVMDPDNTEEVLTTLYMAKNIVMGTRAADEFLLDWSDVSFEEVSATQHGGVTIRPVLSKNNREGQDRPRGLHGRTGAGAVKRGADGKWVLPEKLCPVRLAAHAQVLLARDAGVEVAQLEAPVFSDCRRIKQLPAGATLVRSERGSVAEKAKSLVLVVTVKQEEQGLFYNRSQPFTFQGRKWKPPCRGVWFEVAEKGYAVRAWASAGGVTQRIRKMMRKVNGRAEEEVLPEKTIKKLSSKSCRIAMATLLMRANVPMPEIVSNGDWEDEAMARTYVRSYAPMAVQQRNLTNTIFGGGEAGGGEAAVQGAAAGALQLAAVGPVEAVTSAEVVAPAVAAAVVVVAPAGRKKHKELTIRQPCCPPLWVKGRVFKRTNIQGDPSLQRLLEETAGEKLPQVQKVLCNAHYHVTQKEIENFRMRLAQQAALAPEVEPQELLGVLQVGALQG